MENAALADDSAQTAGDTSIGGIPIRNLWLLMLYASDLFRMQGNKMIAAEEDPDEIPDLVAEILAHLVTKRLERNLTFGYRNRHEVLNRVRGRIDFLTTERHQLLARGTIACRFEDLTVDTPRNRFVLAALTAVADIVSRPDLSHNCRVLASRLKRLGVAGGKPTGKEIETERYGHHDAEDRVMVTAAKLALDLALPTEAGGTQYLVSPNRDSITLWLLFQKAVYGFYDVVLSVQGWRVQSGRWLNWLIDDETPGIREILPSMQTDIVLDYPATDRRIVIDTKFSKITTTGRYRKESLQSGHIYQMYSYLRSQEGTGDIAAETAAGLLLHPSVGKMVNETVVIQGHALRFATVDLGAKTSEIRQQLLKVVDFKV